jgi:hypothetical protein
MCTARNPVFFDEQLLRDFIARVNSVFPLSHAYLFGSRARGDALFSSDYDILLVSEAFEGLDFSERMRRVCEHWTAREGLEVLCYTPEEFDRKRRQICIVKQAAEEGRRLL